MSDRAGETPRYELRLQSTGRNVFVTQLGETREEADEDVTQIPIIREAAGRILDGSKKTLQKTLVLKKEVEYDRVSQELVHKRREFSERMRDLEERREELKVREKEYSEKAAKFEKFLKDGEAKQSRAMVRYQAESRHNRLRQVEIRRLAEQLEEMRLRQVKLQERKDRNKIYEDFLLKMVERVPDNYLEYGMDSPVKAIIRRYETLSLTNENLVNNLTALSDEQERTQHSLEALRRRHDTLKLTMTSELSQLQLDYDRLQEKNKQLELTFNLEKSQFRNQSVELGSLLLAIVNLADQCHMKHYGALAEVDLTEKLDMIKEYILEKIQIERLARKPFEELQLLFNPEEHLRRRKKTANQKKKGSDKDSP